MSLFKLLEQRPAAEAAGGGHAATAALSPAEIRFDRWRRSIGLFLGPLGFLLMWAVPTPDLSVEAHRLAAVTVLVVIWWTTEALPFAATSLVGSGLAVLCGVAHADEVFAPYASPTIFLFIGSFTLALSAAHHGLDKRMARAVLSWRLSRGLSGVRIMIGLLALLTSAWVSNAATVAMMLPVIIGLGTSVLASHGGHGRRYVVGFLLIVAYSAGIGGTITPVGSPPNLITLGLLERVAHVHIGFHTWMLAMVPIALACALVLYPLVHWLFPEPRGAEVSDLSFAAEDGAARWTAGQRNSAIAFAVAVIVWLTPGVVSLVAGPESDVARYVASRLNVGAVAVLAAGLLFVLPTNWSERQFTLNWQQASRIDWGTILLFGGGLSLGELMFATGLAERIGTPLLQLTGAHSLWAVTAIGIAVGMVLSEFVGHTPCTSMLVPVVLTMSLAANLNPVPPALGVMLGVNSGYMLPISSGHNAIIYGTRMLPITAMIKVGLLLKILTYPIILIGLRLLCPLLGLA
jgi:sodium-dependent dicarboxylate transporter 2/3/5